MMPNTEPMPMYMVASFCGSNVSVFPGRREA
jgi:hypothetical protein